MTTVHRLVLLLGLTVLGPVTACVGDGSGPDRITNACERITDAACAKYVECRATNNGTLFTPALCSQVRAQVVDDCRTKQGPGISAATDADINSCVQGMHAFLCTNLCGRVPQDPPACDKLDPTTPNVHAVTCAPGTNTYSGTAHGAARERLADTAVEDVKHLVVMIETTFDDTKLFGAGIIFGVDADALLVLTANHVVRHGDTAPRVQMTARWNPGKSVPATVTQQYDDSLDVAVLRVPMSPALAADLEALPFDRLGNPAEIGRGDDVFLLGNPEERPWAMTSVPGKLTEADEKFLEFDSSLTEGHSGGALLDGRLNVVGVLTTDQGFHGRAVRIDKAIEKLRAWGYGVRLGQQVTPERYVSVSAGSQRACAISQGGTAYCWGEVGTYSDHAERGSRRFSKRPLRVRGGLRFAQVSVGIYHACGVTGGGEAYCWGHNSYGQLGDTTMIDSEDPVRVSGGLAFESVSAGFDITCGVATNGSAYCWGGEGGVTTPKQLGGEMKFRWVIAGENTVPYAGTRTGEVYLFFTYDSPKRVEGSPKLTSADGECGVAEGGDVHCWNRCGNRRYVLVQLPRPSGVMLASVSGRSGRYCALDGEGKLYCWGVSCKRGAGGEGWENDIHVEPPRADPRFRSVSLGRQLSCGVTGDHSLYCWGALTGILFGGEPADSRTVNYGATPVRIR